MQGIKKNMKKISPQANHNNGEAKPSSENWRGFFCLQVGLSVQKRFSRCRCLV